MLSMTGNTGTYEHRQPKWSAIYIFCGPILSSHQSFHKAAQVVSNLYYQLSSKNINATIFLA